MQQHLERLRVAVAAKQREAANLEAYLREGA
jgi:hypothetical protein